MQEIKETKINVWKEAIERKNQTIEKKRNINKRTKRNNKDSGCSLVSIAMISIMLTIVLLSYIMYTMLFMYQKKEVIVTKANDLIVIEQ